MTKMSKEEFLAKYDYSEDLIFSECLLDLYTDVIAENERLLFAYDYTLDMLKEICRERNISYNSNSMALLLSFLDGLNKDSYLKDILKKLSFDFKLFADPDKLEDFLDKKVSECRTADEMDFFVIDYEIIIDEFRSFFAKKFTGHLFGDLLMLDRERQKSIEVVEDTGIDVNSLGEIIDTDESDIWDDELGEVDWDGTWEGEWDDVEEQLTAPDSKREITDELIKEYIEFFILAYLINAIYVDCKRIHGQLCEIKKQMKLSEFGEDVDFIEEVKRIMSHDRDRSCYHYHGTQDGKEMNDASKALKEGLLITGGIQSTSYPEITLEQLLLFRKGFVGEIGDSAVVIIDQPIVDGSLVDIVEELDDDTEYSFFPSGLQGIDNKPDHIVPSKYIVGYVDKYHKKVVYNPLYYDYENKVGKGQKV